MEEKSEFITRRFNCKICNTTHEITLNKSLCEDRTRFPFTHVYLHGDLKDILTILHIDKDLQIRAVEVEQLSIENIFSKDQVVEIIGKLVDEIEVLREDYNNLFEKYQEIKDKVGENQIIGWIKSLGENVMDFIKNIFDN